MTRGHIAMCPKIRRLCGTSSPHIRYLEQRFLAHHATGYDYAPLDPDYINNLGCRRSADMAVQLGMGLLSVWRAWYSSHHYSDPGVTRRHIDSRGNIMAAP